MLVQHRSCDETNVIGPEGNRERLHARLANYLDRVSLSVRRLHPSSDWSTQWRGNPVARRALRMGADVVNLHWVESGFVPITLLRSFSVPVVWTMHDMWPITGGCHYDEGCGGYRDKCGRCPILGSARENDLSRSIVARKCGAWARRELTVVTPSRWLAECVRASSLFRGRRIEVIPYGVPLDRFRPIPRAVARDLLGLPQDRLLIAFGAVAGLSDRRKGFDLLAAALQRLDAGKGKTAGLLVFGASAPPEPLVPSIPSWFLGHLHDEISVALAYAAADVFVAPSRQDNLPNTVMEAAACGIPCVAFDVGGIPEIIEHCRSGYLAVPEDVDDMARGIEMVLDSPELAANWGARSRARAEVEFGLARQAGAYVELYQELIARGVSR